MRNVLVRFSVFLFLIISSAPQVGAQHPWQATGYSSGGVQCLAANAAGDLFAGIPDGLNISTNNGNTWDTLQTTLFGDPFAILITPDSQKIFIAVESGVYRSTNNGLDWIRLGNEVAGVYSLARQRNGDIYGSGSGGLFRSTDEGETWTQVLPELGIFNDGILLPDTATILTASITEGLFRSTDHGATWTELTPIAGLVTAMAQSRMTGTILVASGIPHPVFGMWPFLLYRSTDNGESWSAPDTLSALTDLLYADSHGGIFASIDSLYRTTDDGLTWTSVSDSLPPGFRIMAIVESRGVLYAGDEFHGIYKNTSLLADALLPPQPVLLFPPEGETDVPSPVTLAWQWIPGAIAFHLEISTDPTFLSPLFSDSMITTTSESLPLPDCGCGIDYWRVRCRNSLGWGPWSEIRTFAVRLSEIVALVEIAPGWQMISFPLRPGDSIATSLIPQAASPAFRYATGYEARNAVFGKEGYWMRFADADNIPILTANVRTDTVDVVSGWNLVGSPAFNTTADSITSIPPDIIDSPFFGFASGYSEAATIATGKAYWVKVKELGRLVFNAPVITR